MKKLRIISSILIITSSILLFYAGLREYGLRKDLLRIYNSDYFSVIDEEFSLVEDMLENVLLASGSNTVLWAAAGDISDKYGISISFYPFSHDYLGVPDEFKMKHHELPVNFLNSSESKSVTNISESTYTVFKPFHADNRTKIFFGRTGDFKIGIFKFTKKYIPGPILNNERIFILFLSGTAVLIIGIVLLLYSPGRKVNNMFVSLSDIKKKDSAKNAEQ